MQHKLDIEDLNVETFTTEPVVASFAAAGTAAGIVWTGCMSECSECGMPCGGGMGEW